MQFDTAQAAFLAGYLAAGYSKTGKVATYGGLKIPPVTVFMDGFADGVAYYNKAKGKNVQVLGWDKAKQNGTVRREFSDQNKGKAITDTFVAQGADVIMPVAGGTGLGTAARQGVRRQGLGHLGRPDGCESAAQYCAVFLTTVVKNIADAVKEAVGQGRQGQHPLRPAATWARWRTTASRSRRTTSSTARSPRTSRPRSTSSRRTSSPARSRSSRRRSRSDYVR